jgi:hypothetical protein
MNLQRFINNIPNVKVGNVLPKKPVIVHNAWNVSAFDSYENPPIVPGGLGVGLGASYNPDDTVQKFLLGQAWNVIMQRNENINESNHAYVKDTQYLLTDFNDVVTAHPNYLPYTFTKGDRALLHHDASIDFQNMRIENDVFLFDVVWYVKHFYHAGPNQEGITEYIEANDDVFGDNNVIDG